MEQCTENEMRIGALNQAPTFNLTPGPRGSNIFVTEDGRVLLLRLNDENYLLFPNQTWYEFRTERVLTVGMDYPVIRIKDKDWNPFTDLFNQPPMIGECWEVTFGGFKMTYKTEELAREAAVRHKISFGGVKGTYEPMGWYPVRIISQDESGSLGF